MKFLGLFNEVKCDEIQNKDIAIEETINKAKNLAKYYIREVIEYQKIADITKELSTKILNSTLIKSYW